MKRTILMLLLSAISAFGEKPWPGVEFTEVRAYAWRHKVPNDYKGERMVLPGMKLKTGEINKGGTVLNPGQVKQFIAAVSGKHAEHASGLCYDPHNAFVVYDAAKQPVAYVEICFTCTNEIVHPANENGAVDLLSLASIFTALKLPMGEYRDLAAFEKDFAPIIAPSKK